MAKPKHPTLKSLRQGQTVYLVSDPSFMRRDNSPKTVTTYHLYSHKTPLPPEGFIIEKLPVSNLQRAIRQYGQQVMRDFYYSRGKAEAAARN